jgi:hypothetical protein
MRSSGAPVGERCWARFAHFWPFSAASAADIDPERGSARLLYGGAAPARQARPRWSAAGRSVRGGGGCRPAEGHMSEAGEWGPPG